MADVARVAENTKTRALIVNLIKDADLAVTSASDADCQRYHQQMMHDAESLVNHSAAVADRIGQRAGGCIR